MSYVCDSEACELCHPELAADLPNDSRLACHCGWLHRDAKHNPDWYRWMAERGQAVNQ